MLGAGIPSNVFCITFLAHMTDQSCRGAGKAIGIAVPYCIRGVATNVLNEVPNKSG